MRILVLLLCLRAFACENESTENIPPDDPAYRKIEKILASGLLPEIIYTQRPWSKREFRRLVLIARENKEPVSSYVRGLVDDLSQRFGEQCGGQPLSKVELELITSDEKQRLLTTENGLNKIHAKLPTLSRYSFGRENVDGLASWMRTSHSFEYRYFSAFARPGGRLSLPRNGSPESLFYFENLYAKMAIANFEFQLGRDSLIWGQGEAGGLLLSSNARPLDMFKITTTSPFLLPFFLSSLGPAKFTFFVARFPDNSIPPNDYFYGLRGSFRPIRELEIGVQHTIFMGGPDVRWFDPITEFFFIRADDITGRTGGSNGDHRFGADARFRFSKVEMYFEGVLEDCCRETVASNFTDWLAVKFGVFLPLLGEEGRGDFRLEYNRIPAGLYRHSYHEAGHSLDRYLLGNALGPDGTGLEAPFRLDLLSETTLTISAANEIYGGNYYGFTTSSHGQPNAVYVAKVGLDEYRYRLMGGIEQKLSDSLSLLGRAGYEHVVHYNFESGVSLDQYIVGALLRWTP